MGILIGALVLGMLVVPMFLSGADDKAGEWKQLFNGKDLTGWDTWLGRPHKHVEGVDLKKNDKGEYEGVVGLNKDPKKVYTVVQVDGKPAIRVSGEIWGALTSKDEFENYHLKLEFRWGDKKWPPRDNTVRDSGLLYHCIGPHGAQGTFWMQSLESQIQEHDCGDFYSVAGPTVDVEGERKTDKGPITYKKGGTKFTNVRSRIIRDVDHEKPVGQWNTMELIAVGETCIHIVNGKANLILTNPKGKLDGKDVPLTRGKIQLQSEGAEVFYRNIAVRPLSKIPDEYRK
jgi:hypothetical protein